MDGRKIVKMMFDAWHSRDWDAIRNVLHVDYVYTGTDGKSVAGVEDGLAAAWSSFADSFSDGKVELGPTFLDGNTVITELHFTGTHTGDFEGVAPTGKKVEVDFCNVMELKDGKVVRERDYTDTLGFMAQLGAVKRP